MLKESLPHHTLHILSQQLEDLCFRCFFNIYANVVKLNDSLFKTLVLLVKKYIDFLHKANFRLS